MKSEEQDSILQPQPIHTGDPAEVDHHDKNFMEGDGEPEKDSHEIPQKEKVIDPGNEHHHLINPDDKNV